MWSPSFIRRGVCLLLVVALILPTSAAPVQAALDVWAAQAAAAHDRTPTSDTDRRSPCEEGCCPRATCDLSACIATGLLPWIASMPVAAPPVPFVFAWRSKAPRALVVDTPLRPPIV